VLEKKGEGKGKDHPITGHKGPDGKLRYTSTLSLTSALDGVGGQRHASAALPPEKDLVPIVLEAGWASEPVWTGVENLAPPSTEFDPRIALPIAQSLYRLSYRGPSRKG
jgi:hypothetical protein